MVSKLNSNERLALWGAVLSIVGTILTFIGGFGFGGLWLTFLLALAMIVILFLPTWSPGTTLPGSKGSLMLIVGGIAGIGAILGLLAFIGVIGLLGSYLFYVIGLLIGIIGGLLMGWGSWKEFQAEGGKFQLGAASAAPAGGGAAPPASDPAPPPAAPPASDPAPPPAADAGTDMNDPEDRSRP